MKNTEVLQLFKSLGIKTKNLKNEEVINHYSYKDSNFWAYKIDLDTKIIEVNTSYFCYSKAIKKHNKKQRKKYDKTSAKLINMYGFCLKRYEKMTINDKVNLNLFGNLEVKYLL